MIMTCPTADSSAAWFLVAQRGVLFLNIDSSKNDDKKICPQSFNNFAKDSSILRFHNGSRSIFVSTRKRN